MIEYKKDTAEQIEADRQAFIDARKTQGDLITKRDTQRAEDQAAKELGEKIAREEQRMQTVFDLAREVITQTKTSAERTIRDFSVNINGSDYYLEFSDFSRPDEVRVVLKDSINKKSYEVSLIKELKTEKWKAQIQDHSEAQNSGWKKSNRGDSSIYAKDLVETGFQDLLIVEEALIQAKSILNSSPENKQAVA